MYYRVAIQGDPAPPWQWKSTALSELSAVFQFLRLYRALPQDRLRVFSSSSRKEMNEQLMRENKGFRSTSVTAAQFFEERMIGSRGNEPTTSIAVITEHSLNERSWGAQTVDERGMSSLEKRRGELERGAGGDDDLPYRFTLPTSIPQVLAWVKLLAKVQNGELQP